MPMSRCQNITGEAKVGNSMRDDAVSNASRVVVNTIENYTCHDAGEDIVMFQAEQNRDRQERKQAEPADCDFGEVAVDQVA